MNKDVIQTHWSEVREILRDKFSHLTEEDIGQINGRYDQLVSKLQQKYGFSKEEAELRIKNWNFDRVAGARGQTIYEERSRGANLSDHGTERGNSSLLKWLLALALPLLAWALYTATSNQTNEVARAPNLTFEQVIVETPLDRAISTSLRNALITDRTLISDVDNVQIRTNNGVVTLSGFVSNAELSDAIAARAERLDGVKRVINNLQVR
jgi:uncharacterized protein YjbJ (UPF0337 family)